MCFSLMPCLGNEVQYFQICFPCRNNNRTLQSLQVMLSPVIGRWTVLWVVIKLSYVSSVTVFFCLFTLEDKHLVAYNCPILCVFFFFLICNLLTCPLLFTIIRLFLISTHNWTKLVCVFPQIRKVQFVQQCYSSTGCFLFPVSAEGAHCSRSVKQASWGLIFLGGMKGFTAFSVPAGYRK